MFERLWRLFIPGPFAWIFKTSPPPRRFHPGTHLHGLEDHDVPYRTPVWRGTGIAELPRPWGQDPPAR